MGIAAGALFVAISGCSLFTSLSGYDEDVDRDPDADRDAAADDDRDGGSIDGTSPSESGSDGPPIDSGAHGEAGGVQFVVNGSFESGSCAPMMHTPDKATLASSTNARSGAYACRICNTGAPMGTAAMWQSFPAGMFGPATYTLEAYAKTDGDAGNSLGQTQMTVKNVDGGAPRYPSKQATTAATGWLQLQLDVELLAGERIDSILVGLYSDGVGPCVVFDDVSLVKK